MTTESQANLKFQECTSCKYHRPTGISSICRACDAGEYFEEKIQDDQPDDDELMRILAKMDIEQDD